MNNVYDVSVNMQINTADPAPGNLTDDISRLVTLWNQLYGKALYSIAVPRFGDRLFHLFQNRIIESSPQIVENVIRRIGSSSFLMGRRSEPSVTLTWILQQPNFSKVLSGYYDDFKPRSSKSHAVRKTNSVHVSHERKHPLLERDVDLDAWLIEQIIHKKLYNLPPVPKDTTDLEAYMCS